MDRSNGVFKPHRICPIVKKWIERSERLWYAVYRVDRGQVAEYGGWHADLQRRDDVHRWTPMRGRRLWRAGERRRRLLWNT